MSDAQLLEVRAKGASLGGVQLGLSRAPLTDYLSSNPSSLSVTAITGGILDPTR